MRDLFQWQLAERLRTGTEAQDEGMAEDGEPEAGAGQEEGRREPEPGCTAPRDADTSLDQARAHHHHQLAVVGEVEIVDEVGLRDAVVLRQGQDLAAARPVAEDRGRGVLGPIGDQPQRVVLELDGVKRDVEAADRDALERGVRIPRPHGSEQAGRGGGPEGLGTGNEQPEKLLLRREREIADLPLRQGHLRPRRTARRHVPDVSAGAPRGQVGAEEELGVDGVVGQEGGAVRERGEGVDAAGRETVFVGGGALDAELVSFRFYSHGAAGGAGPDLLAAGAGDRGQGVDVHRGKWEVPARSRLLGSPTSRQVKILPSEISQPEAAEAKSGPDGVPGSRLDVEDVVSAG